MKIVQSLLVCAAAALLAVSCGKPHSISANIKGLGNDTVLVQFLPLNIRAVPVMDTLVAQNGKFTYDMPDSLDFQVYITFPKQVITLPGGRAFQSMQEVIYLVMRNGDQLSVKGSIEEAGYTQYEVKGGQPFNAQYASHRDTYKNTSMKADAFEVTIDQEMLKPDSEEKQAALEGFYKDRGDCYDQIRQTIGDYVKANPATDLSAYYLINYLPLADFGNGYEALAEEVKSGVFGVLLKEREAKWQAYNEVMQAKENIKEGKPAPAFLLKDLNGKDVALESLRGKPVVLDFWGSWCKWCIKGAPEMIRSHDKYGKKVQFVGIACHDSDNNWRKAVAENKLDWTQLFNGEGENDVTKKYALEGYPTKIILDKDLKIVAVFVGESEDFYKKVEELAK